MTIEKKVKFIFALLGERLRLGISASAVLIALSACGAAPRYVFLFIGDGMSAPQRTVAEAFAEKTGYGKLSMNAMPYRADTATKSADGLVTDSAAAATAIACGVKTRNSMLGIAPDGAKTQSVAELAAERGMKVGIITTVPIWHATPAGFYAHRRSRGMIYEIGLDLVGSGFDYFAGGGFGKHADNRKSASYRGHIHDLAKKAGYVVAADTAGWSALTPGTRAVCVFGGGFPFAIDSAGGGLPSLSDLLSKAIELLDSPGGFFIMCEGGKIDYSGHSNDAATNLREVIELDKAVAAAVAFLEKRPDETLVIVTGDHETGGLAPGFGGAGGKFDVELLGLQKVSVESYSGRIKRRIEKCAGRLSLDDLKGELRRDFGFLFPGVEKLPGEKAVELTADDVKSLETALAKDVENVRTRLADTTAHDVARRYVFAQAVKNVLNAHAGVSWSTMSHTALPTLTTAIGRGASIVEGMRENTDIGLRLKKLIGE